MATERVYADGHRFAFAGHIYTVERAADISEVTEPSLGLEAAQHYVCVDETGTARRFSSWFIGNMGSKLDPA